MNIAFFLNRDIHANVALSVLVGALREHRVAVFLSEGVGHAPDLPALDLLRLIEQDIPNQLFPHVETEAEEELRPFRAIERALGTPFETLADPNAPSALERVRALAPDLVVSIRYGRIFKDDFLRIPRRGVLNLHSGLLPDYRGILATLRALLAGDDEIGCTLHFIGDSTIDTGPIVSEARLPVDPEGSLFGHILSLYEPGAGLVLDAVERLSHGENLATRPQPSGGAYFTYPTAREMAAFEKTGRPIFRPSEYRALLRRFVAAP